MFVLEKIDRFATMPSQESAAKFIVLVCLLINTFSGMAPHGLPIYPTILLASLLILFFYSGRFGVSLWWAFLVLPIVWYLYMIAFHSGLSYSTVRAELGNMVAILILILVIAASGLKEAAMRSVVVKYEAHYSKFAFIFSVLGLCKFLFDLAGSQIPFLFTRDGRYPSGASLVVDYNMFAVTIGIGLILTIRKLAIEKLAGIHSWFFSIGFIITGSLCIILSGSRRGILIVLFAIVFYFFVEMARSIYKIRFKRFQLKNVLLCLSVILSPILFLLTSDYNPTDLRTLRFVTSLIQGGDVDAADSRLIRLALGWEILGGYNPTSLMFGGGFDYLAVFGDKFGESMGLEDYPHNFIMSSMLSGGVIFSLITCSYVAVGLWGAFLMRRDYYSIFLIYLVMLFVSLISGSGIFNFSLFLSSSTIILYLMSRFRAGKGGSSAN